MSGGLDSATDTDLWPAGEVTVLSADFAKQADVLDGLLQTRWDLVIAEEGHWIRGRRAEALQELAASSQRVAISSLPGTELPKGFSDQNTTVVEWQRDRVLRKIRRKPLPVPRPTWHETSYILSLGDLDLQASLNILCQASLAGTPQRELVARLVNAAFLSSPAALEALLRRQMDRLDERNGLEPSWVPSGPEESETAEPGDVGRAVRHVAGVQLAKILSRIETLSSDPKVDALTALLNRLDEDRSPSRRVCVLTDFVATLFYLAAGLEAHEVNVQLLHGGRTLEDRLYSLAKFTDTGGILIATRAAMAAGPLSLVEVTDLVFYDFYALPDSADSLHQLLGRFDRIGRTTQLQVHVLVPSNSGDSSVDGRVSRLRELAAMQVMLLTYD